MKSAPLFWMALILALGVFAEETRMPLSASGGRFVLGQISEFRSDTYMLDTQTGRVWQIRLDSDSSRVLGEVSYSMLEYQNGRLTKTLSSLPTKANSVTVPYGPQPTAAVKDAPYHAPETSPENWYSDSLAMAQDCVAAEAFSVPCRDFFKKVSAMKRKK